jgi:hypothetical protein
MFDDKSLDGILKRHFPSSTQVSADLDWTADEDMDIVIRLGFPLADPNMIDPKVCAACCKEIRAHVQFVVAALTDDWFASRLNIRIQLVFLELRHGHNASDN